MSEPKRSFALTVEGQYYGAHGQTGLPIIKNYTAKFVLPSQEAALSVIVRHLLKPYLAKFYPDYASVRTHKITSVSHSGRLPDPRVNQMPFEDMGVADLSDFCILNQIFIDPYKHKSLEACREQVQTIYHRRSDEKKLAKKTGKDVEQKEVAELLALNDLKSLDESIPNLNEQRQGAALKNRGDGRAEVRVGHEAIAPAAGHLPLADSPVMQEEPVNNDPALTAKAFEEAAKADPEDIFS